MQTVALDAAVFLVCFAFGFLIAGRRRILALSTRVALLALAAVAAAFALCDAEPYHLLLGAGGIAATVLFVAFLAIDMYRYGNRV